MVFPPILVLFKIEQSHILKFTRGRRSNLTIKIFLVFATGLDEEPLLGFEIHPSIQFIEDKKGFFPTAMTCINQLKLPRSSLVKDIPTNEDLLNLYDFVFSNSYFGLM